MANVLQPVREVRFCTVAEHFSSDGSVERATLTQEAELPEQPGTCREEAGARSGDFRQPDAGSSGAFYGMDEEEMELWGLTDQSWTEKRESILGSGRGTPREYQAPAYFRADMIKGPGAGSVNIHPELKLAPPPVFAPAISPFSRPSPFARSSSVATPGGSAH